MLLSPGDPDQVEPNLARGRESLGRRRGESSSVRKTFHHQDISYCGVTLLSVQTLHVSSRLDHFLFITQTQT